MYQINLTVSADKKDWVKRRQKFLYDAVGGIGGVYAESENFGILYMAIAGESELKNIIEDAVKTFLSAVYSYDIKYSYLSEKLKLNLESEYSKQLLIHTLSVFDRERDIDYIDKKLEIYGNYSIDGFFNFKLPELKKRWDEILELTDENKMLLTDERAFNLLIRFLLSAVKPKIDKVEIRGIEGIYYITSDGYAESAENKQQLIFKLIDIAPLEITVCGGAYTEDIIYQLKNLFDISHTDNKLKLGENY